MLSGYRVLDLADEKGVVCGMLLAEMGADVIKVEPPCGDKGRLRGPFFHDEVHPEKSLYFLYHNVGKRSITLNLDDDEGRGLFRELVKTVDIILESHDPGYLVGIGLGYESLKQINPGLVMVSITPFGQSGPHAGYLGTDLTAMATSGLMQMIGMPEGPPVRFGGEHTHWPSAEYAAVGAVAALYDRDFGSGKGQHVDISMQETLLTHYMENHPALTWLKTGQNVIRPGHHSRVHVPYGVYPAKDGWVEMCMTNPAEWEGLSAWVHEVTGNDAILNPDYKGLAHVRGPYVDEIIAMITEFTVQMDKWTLFHEGQKRNVVIMPACTVEDILIDPHLAEAGFWVELDHPVVGRLKYPRGPFYSEDIDVPQKAAPLLGEHNADVYLKEMGMSPERLTTLRGIGAL